MYPTFLIAGPPRSASTSLYYYMCQHPQVYMSPAKETEFFTRDYYKGTDFYQQYFKKAGNAVAIGEATPAYSFLPFAADRIQAATPNVKLIFCFRNPVERAYSHWLMLYNEGIEEKNFSEAIRINKNQLRYINFEGDAGAELWNKTAAHKKKEADWIRPYLHPGMYAASLKMYMKRFNTDNIKVIFTDDLKNNFDKTMQDLFTFIGVNNSFIVPVKTIQNASGDKKIYRLLASMFGFNVAGAVSKYVPASVKKIFRKEKSAHTSFSREDALLLWQIYKPDIEELSKITGRDLSPWSPTDHFREHKMYGVV